MSKCQAGLLAMTVVPRAEAGTILHGMMTVVLSASDVTTARDALIDRCELVKKMMDDVISRCQTISEVTSQPSVSNGSDAFTWTCQQLSSTGWRGPRKTNNSYTRWAFVGKPGTSEDSGLINLGSVTRPAMSTSAYTSMIREALQNLGKSIAEAEAEKHRQGL